MGNWNRGDGIIALYAIFNHYAKDLPKLDSLKDYTPSVITEVFDKDGNKVGEFWKEKRILLQPHEIPDMVKKAIIASEDDRFFEHSGIDYFGIVRAMIENIKAGHISQGGSTITQQVIKTFILTNERTYERKIKEAILAHRLEKNFSKEEILYLYLNQVFFGNRAYGIEAAAQNYFRKPAKELTIAESAMLAGLVKAPYSYSPVRNYKKAKTRQAYVLKRMNAVGFITDEEFKTAKAQELIYYKSPTDKVINKRYAPWFVEEIRRKLIEKYGEDAIYAQGLKVYTSLDLKAQKAAKNAILKGLTQIHKRHGYHLPKQRLHHQEVQNFLKSYHAKLYKESLEYGRVLFLSDDEIWNLESPKLDPQKIYKAVVLNISKNIVTVQVGKNQGDITVKGYGWARKRNNRSRGYNDVTYQRNPNRILKVGNVIEVKLDTRSHKTYKKDQTYFTLEQTPEIEGALFSYDPQLGYVRAVIGGKDFNKSEFNRATQAKRQPGSIFKPFLYASAIDKGYVQDTIIVDEPIKVPLGKNKFWEPKNYGHGYKGPMTLRSALLSSRNIVSVKIIVDVGVEYVTAFVRKLGITTKIQKVPSMSLGSNDMKLFEVTRAFGVYPNYGYLPELIWIKKVTNRFGKVLEENLPNPPMAFYDQIDKGVHKQQSLPSLDDTDYVYALKEDLYNDALSFIDRDNLKLTPQEKVILYGKYLPKDYVMNPRTAFSMVEIMQGIVQYGTATEVRKLKRPAGGKTGTTNDQTDCWFVGFVPDLVAGVWVGHDKNYNKVGGGETGGKAAAPIFTYYMKEYLEGTPVKKFKKPKYLAHSALDLPLEVYPGDIQDILGDPLEDNKGGADYFLEDL